MTEEFRGIDVSAYDGNIDWAAVKKSGVQFAIIRCGYGQDTPSQDDVKLSQNIAGCEEHGIPWGTYLYSYATDLAGAASEVAHVLRLMAGHRPLYPIFIDMEDADGYKAKHGVTYGMMKDIGAAFCTGIRQAGGLPGVYASRDWLVNKLAGEWLADCEIWLSPGGI